MRLEYEYTSDEVDLLATDWSKDGVRKLTRVSFEAKDVLRMMDDPELYREGLRLLAERFV